MKTWILNIIIVWVIWISIWKSMLLKTSPNRKITKREFFCIKIWISSYNVTFHRFFVIYGARTLWNIATTDVKHFSGVKVLMSIEEEVNYSEHVKSIKRLMEEYFLCIYSVIMFHMNQNYVDNFKFSRHFSWFLKSIRFYEISWNITFIYIWRYTSIHKISFTHETFEYWLKSDNNRNKATWNSNNNF